MAKSSIKTVETVLQDLRTDFITHSKLDEERHKSIEHLFSDVKDCLVTHKRETQTILETHAKKIEDILLAKAHLMGIWNTSRVMGAVFLTIIGGTLGAVIKQIFF